jgi:Putative peptidoglycan binding domain
MNKLCALFVVLLSGCSMFHSAPAPTPAPAPVAAVPVDSTLAPAQIRGYQQQLLDDGFYGFIGSYRHPVDGIWGHTSAVALMKYQRAHNLPDTGLLDASSRASLDAATPAPAAPRDARDAPRYDNPDRPNP